MLIAEEARYEPQLRILSNDSHQCCAEYAGCASSMQRLYGLVGIGH